MPGHVSGLKESGLPGLGTMQQRNNFVKGIEEPKKVISMFIDLPGCRGSRKLHYHESNKSAL